MSTPLLRELVAHALLQGSLYGALGASKTLTVCGKRRYRMRLQCDIFNAVYGGQAAWYYPDIAPLIREYVEELRP